MASGASGDFYDADPQCWKEVGCKVIATTHKESKLPLLKGADEAGLSARLAFLAVFMP